MRNVPGHHNGCPGPGASRRADGEPPGGRILFSLMCELQGRVGGLHWVTRTLLMQCFFLVLQPRKGRKRTSGQAQMPRSPGFTRRPGPRPPSTGSRCYPPVPSSSSLALSIMPCFFPFTCPYHPKCPKWGGTRDSGQLAHPPKGSDFPGPTSLFLVMPLLRIK